MDPQKITSIAQLRQIKEETLARQARYSRQVLVCCGGGCVSSDCAAVRDAVLDEIARHGLSGQVEVIETGCMGTCSVGPVMLILPERTFYVSLTPDSARAVIRSHGVNGVILMEHTYFDPVRKVHIPCMDDITFFREQVRIALRNCGVMAYGSLEAAIARDGYLAAARATGEMTPRQVVDEVKKSGLRGRGGAGFPTGVKWEAGLNAPGDIKYIVCNADEGDPGAFMDRSIVEGDPHAVIEGMILGGYAIGAYKGYVYIRAEYPLAVERLSAAIGQVRARGLLGGPLFGSGFSFDMEIRIGAGAFVCGEETALMASIEGRRGEPKQKPPFPFQQGLFGKPTIINNVETLVCVPAILLHGADWYAGYGTAASHGTKVFALAGDVVNTGIAEVPIGTPLGNILFTIGGGMRGGKKFKAAQIGGPSGGCITRENLNTPTDYESLTRLGAIMGSGGLIAMSEDACMVDTARFFMDFIKDESCGKCTACRLGTRRMLEILERITRGQGREGDIELLEELCHTIADTALCGLGQTAPNPVLGAIRYFREEFEEHIHKKRCRAGVCSDLFLSPCENACPAGVNIPGYLALAAAGRFTDAYRLVRQENPFPAVCGRICTRPCESRCRRGTLDEPVAICDLKRFVADYALRSEQPADQGAPFPRNGKRVAVIGAGASGLTCGYYLARIGYEVDVYESQPVAGGVLAFGIPEYRLPKKVLQREIALIAQAGVNILLGTEVGRDISVEQLRLRYDAVYVAAGTQSPQRVQVPGETLTGIHHGIDFLKAVNLGRDMKVGPTVAVIGGGNTAIDSARTALRLGARRVILLYRRTLDAMPASRTEIHEAVEEGIEIMELVAPVGFIAGSEGRVAAIECVRMALGDFDDTGRRKSVPIEDSSFRLEADTVIPAVSQHTDLSFINKDEVGLTRWGTFIIQEDTRMSTLDGVFAGGDVVHGPDTVIQAIADGKQAASAIDRYLGGSGKLNKGEPIDIPCGTDEDEIVCHPRFSQELRSPDARRDGFDEVALGYHKLDAMAEAMRCLHCDRR